MTAPTAKRGRGRPRLADPATIKITISLTRSIIDALDDRAEVEGMARATAVRAACEEWASANPNTMCDGDLPTTDERGVE